MVVFFKITFDASTAPHFSMYATNVLSANSLSFDSFRVSAMVLLPNTSIVVFAIQNYGILLYDVVTFKILRLISVISEVMNLEFKIISVIAENKHNLNLIFESLGVMSIFLEEDIFDESNTLGNYTIHTHFGLR